MANAFLEFEIKWMEVQTTGEPCFACKEPIYGRQYQLFIEPGGAAEVVLCQSCYQAIEQPDS